MKNKITLSATAVKGFLDCSWLFYQTRMMKVPDHTHPKTKIGTLAHSILEGFSKKKHAKLLQTTILNQTIYACPSLARLVKMFRAKNPDVTDEIIGELDKLIFVALNHDWTCKDAKNVLPPEHPFEIDFGDFQIKGFMDRVIIYDNVAIIRDYKTQSKRFTQDQMDYNIQAMFYQTAIKHQFGLPAQVEFLLLRFPANKKDPERYIQSVAPLCDDQIEGFKYYLSSINEQINKINEENAKENLKVFEDEGFCIRVCSLKDPFEYWALLGEAEKPLASVRIPKGGIGDQNPEEWAEKQLKPKDGQRIEKRRYAGCPGFFSKEGRPRNFN